MIDLYTWATPNGRKVSIALEEFGESFRVHPIDIRKDEQFAAEFLLISPNNKIPAIVDHNPIAGSAVRSGKRSLMESGAILVYLADKHNRFWGADRFVTLEWLMLQMGSVGPMFGQMHHFSRFNPGTAPYAEERYRTETHRLYGVLNKRLAGEEYLAGEYSIADMATWPWVSRYEWHQINWSDYPHLLRWYESIALREPVRRGFDVPASGASVPVPEVTGSR